MTPAEFHRLAKEAMRQTEKDMLRKLEMNDAQIRKLEAEIEWYKAQIAQREKARKEQMAAKHKAIDEMPRLFDD